MMRIVMSITLVAAVCAAVFVSICLSGCDTPASYNKENVTFRSEPCPCVEEMVAKDKQQYLEYDCSLGTMLACMEQALLTEEECEQLVILQGGQLDTWMKWQQLNQEAQQFCDEQGMC